MMKVDVQEARTHLSRYLEQVEKGAVVVICRHNRPIAEIRAIEPAPLRPIRIPGLLKEEISYEPDVFLPMTDTELAEFDRPSVGREWGRLRRENRGRAEKED